MFLITFLPHSKNGDFSPYLNALSSAITQILNKRLWTRSSPPLTLAEKQNITKNASLESCGTYFALVNIHRCRSQDHRWILSMFRRVWGLITTVDGTVLSGKFSSDTILNCHPTNYVFVFKCQKMCRHRCRHRLLLYLLLLLKSQCMNYGTML